MFTFSFHISNTCKLNDKKTTKIYKFNRFSHNLKIKNFVNSFSYHRILMTFYFKDFCFLFIYITEAFLYQVFSSKMWRNSIQIVPAWNQLFSRKHEIQVRRSFFQIKLRWNNVCDTHQQIIMQWRVLRPEFVVFDTNSLQKWRAGRRIW